MAFSHGNKQSGFALVYAMVGIIFVSTLFYYLSDSVVLLNRQAHRSLSLTQGRMVLHSFMDYTIFGIKQMWCFDDAWIPADPCFISNPRSVERLIINSDSFRTLNEEEDPDIPPLDVIEGNVDLVGMLPDHPLYQILAPARTLVPSISEIEIRITKDLRPQLSVGGREMFLIIKIRVLDSTGQVVRWMGVEMESESEVLVYPRELGSFALIAAKNIRMDLAYNANSQPGDVVFHQFPAKSQVTGWAGLIFESPVFANENLHLPSIVGSDPTNPRYSAVTFSEKLYLGENRVMRDGSDFRPRTAGGNRDQMWSQVSEFGGLQKGIESDGGKDRGLALLAGDIGGNLVDDGQLQRCVNMVGARSQLDRTRDSQINAVLKQGSLESGLVYRTGFTRRDRDILSADDIYEDGNWIKPQPGVGSGSLGAVGRATLTWNNPVQGGTYTLEGLLGYGYPLTREYRPPPSPEIQVRRDEIVRLDRDIQDATDRRDDLLNDVPVNQAAVAAENANIQRLTAQRTAAIARRDFLIEVSQRVANVTVEFQRVVIQNVPTDKFADVALRITPLSGFVDSSGIPMAANLTLKMFDVSCSGDNCRMDWTQCQGNSGNNNNNNNNNNNSGGPNCLSRNDLRAVRTNEYMQQGSMTFSPGPNGTYSLPSGLRRTGSSDSTVYNDIADDTQNWGALAAACTYSPTASYGGADWADDFLGSTYKSWNWSPAQRSLTSPGSYTNPTNVFRLNQSNATPTGADFDFHVKSLVNECIIESQARFVAGFFNCRELRIEPRTAPLRIIGTFILSKAVIDPSAYQAGIRWGSIYSTMATPELRRYNLLRSVQLTSSHTGSGVIACRNLGLSNIPMWNPFPSVMDMANNFSCGVVSLRNKANPFTWTQVEPDCGYSVGENTPTCKNRVVKSVVYELSRKSRL